MIRELLEAEHSKRQVLKIVAFVGRKQARFDELISFCYGIELLLAQRASWPVRYCVESNPFFVNKHLKKMLQQIRKPGHPAIRRNYIKSFEYIDIPKSIEANLIAVCFDCLNDKKEYVAIKVYAMSVLEKIANKYPELNVELKASIESQMEFEKAGFRSRGRKLIRSFKNT